MTTTQKTARATKRDAKLIDDRIDRVYRARCQNVQIDIMDIGTVFALGRKAIADGVDDAALGDALAAFVQTIRKN